MRGLRSTIALIVVLAGLGAYIYFVTWKTAGRRPAPKQEKVFAGVEADKIEEIEGQVGERRGHDAQEGQRHWQIVAPVAAKADEIGSRRASPTRSASSRSSASSTRTRPT